MISRLLVQPFVYKLIQSLLAPGRNTLLAPRLRALSEFRKPKDQVLDIGCGPWSAFCPDRPFPVGCDYSEINIASYVGADGMGVAGSADYLPFGPESFKSVLCIGLFHHLNNDEVKMAISEMLRVCKPGGDLVVVDGVLPIKPWYRPFAFFVRKMDRGRFMRYQSELTDFLTDAYSGWSIERMTTTYTGLEAIICRLHIPLDEN